MLLGEDASPGRHVQLLPMVSPLRPSRKQPIWMFIESNAAEQVVPERQGQVEVAEEVELEHRVAQLEGGVVAAGETTIPPH